MGEDYKSLNLISDIINNFIDRQRDSIEELNKLNSSMSNAMAGLNKIESHFTNGFRRFPHYDNYWKDGGFDNNFSNGFENNSDYYGVNYTGGFNYGFSIDFDRYSGGGFEARGFDKTGFKHPA